jgi:four helix bundle protein
VAPERAREKSFEDLVAWQKATALVTTIYRLSAQWPTEERFGLTNQIRRAAVSVPSNIAEGQGRQGAVELKRFLSVAHGSLCEVQTQLYIARNLGFSAPETIDAALSDTREVGRILRGLYNSLS